MKKTSDCNSRALLIIKAPTKKEREMPELTTRYQLFYNTLESQALTYEEILSVLLGFLYFPKHIF